MSSRSENTAKTKDGGNKVGKRDRDNNHQDDPDNTEKIRVGRDFQAVCPQMLQAPSDILNGILEKAVLVWRPAQELSDEKLEEYIRVAKAKHGYNAEQALGMLFWHKNDIEKALLDLGNFTPHLDEWSTEDQVLFEQAYQFHGKSFNRIRQMLPDKSVASLVKFYYSWKKTRQKLSVIDVQEKMLQHNTSPDNGSEKESNDTSDVEGEKPTNTIRPAISLSISLEEKNTSSLLIDCSGCGVPCSEVNGTGDGKLCHSCYHHYQRTGVSRPTMGPGKRNRPNGTLEKHKKQPPRGIYMNHDDIVSLATASQSEKAQPDILVGMERDLASCRTIIQSKFQRISQFVANNKRFVFLSPPETSNKINGRFTNEENLLVVEGIERHGKDYSRVAATLGTKTESQIKTFCTNNRRRYNWSVKEDLE